MRYHIRTLGCQMNKSDSERIASVLTAQGWTSTSRASTADLVIFNTCSVRQAAEDRVIGLLYNLADQRAQHGTPRVLAVTGCMAGRDQAGQLKKTLPMVDLFFSIAELPYLPRLLAPLFTDLIPAETTGNYLTIAPQYTHPTQAFVPIMSGCNNFCSYCIVPYARGRETSRPVAEVLSELQTLAERGYQEILLLGQNVNSYAPPPPTFSPDNPFQHPFAALLWEIGQIKTLRRVHFTSAHPKDMTEEVVEALGLPHLLNYVHLAVQSGSDAVLHRMNRHYTARDYLTLVEKIRRRRPNIALGTDIIVGFPGETDADFQATVDLYRAADFDIAYLAQYSPRPGTAAAQLPNDIPGPVKKARWLTLQHLMEERTKQKNEAYLGQTVEVLVDHYRSGLAAGFSREQKLVHFPAPPELVNTVAQVHIERTDTWLLTGRLFSSAANQI